MKVVEDMKSGPLFQSEQMFWKGAANLYRSDLFMSN